MADWEHIVVDWGTTNRRAWHLSGNGEVLNAVRDAGGVLANTAEDYPTRIEALRRRFGIRPIMAAGMIGSTLGWREAPYVRVPVALDDLRPIEIDDDVRIVPGVALDTVERADVMRGEEMQALGAMANGAARSDAVFCQPGTHCKWIVVRDRKIVDFRTTMTGELFASLRSGGVLAGMLDGPVVDGTAFREGVARGAGALDLTAALFEVRAGALLGRVDVHDAASLTSGILIGADVGARDDLADVSILATGTPADLYRVAIEQLGGSSTTIDGEAAFLAGMHALRRTHP